MTNPFFPEIVQSFEDIAVEHGYEILLTSTVHDPKRMEGSVRRMIERRVEGVAILTFGMEESLLEGLRFRKVPLVFIDVGPPLPHVCNIRIDYQRGIRQAVQHLAALRHERIAFIAGPLHLPSAVTRKAAFESSLREIGMRVDPELVLQGDHTMEGGMRAYDELARKSARPTAIMCSNDMTAIGVIREAYERGVSVPQELSVIGFDDIRLSRFFIPPLTTIQMSQVEIARLAFRALVTEVERETPSSKGTEYVLNTDLVLRKSTALASQK
jgi:LacI family transcriptional regulator